MSCLIKEDINYLHISREKGLLKTETSKTIALKNKFGRKFRKKKNTRTLELVPSIA